MQSRMDQQHDSLRKTLEANTWALQDLRGKLKISPSSRFMTTSSVSPSPTPAPPPDFVLSISTTNSNERKHEVTSSTTSKPAMPSSAPSVATTTTDPPRDISLALQFCTTEQVTDHDITGSDSVFGKPATPTTTMASSTTSSTSTLPHEVAPTISIGITEHLWEMHAKCSMSCRDPNAEAIDGSSATQLEALGADINDPLWSTACLITRPHLVKEVHMQYAEAGVKLAVEARDEFWKSALRKSKPIYNRALVAASTGSYGAYLADGSEYSGSYRVDITAENLKDFHRRRLQVLASAGPDLIVFEVTPHASYTSSCDYCKSVELCRHCISDLGNNLLNISRTNHRQSSKTPKPPWPLCTAVFSSWSGKMQLVSGFLLEVSPWCLSAIYLTVRPAAQQRVQGDGAWLEMRKTCIRSALAISAHVQTAARFRTWCGGVIVTGLVCFSQIIGGKYRGNIASFLVEGNVTDEQSVYLMHGWKPPWVSYACRNISGHHPASSFVKVFLGINIAEVNWKCMVYISGAVILDFWRPVVLLQSCHDAILFDSEACCKLSCEWIITPKLFYSTADHERGGFSFEENCQGISYYFFCVVAHLVHHSISVLRHTMIQLLQTDMQGNMAAKVLEMSRLLMPPWPPPNCRMMLLHFCVSNLSVQPMSMLMGKCAFIGNSGSGSAGSIGT